VIIIVLYKTFHLADNTAQFSGFLKQDSLDMNFPSIFPAYFSIHNFLKL